MACPLGYGAAPPSPPLIDRKWAPVIKALGALAFAAPLLWKQWRRMTAPKQLLPPATVDAVAIAKVPAPYFKETTSCELSDFNIIHFTCVSGNCRCV